MLKSWRINSSSSRLGRAVLLSAGDGEAAGNTTAGQERCSALRVLHCWLQRGAQGWIRVLGFSQVWAGGVILQGLTYNTRRDEGAPQPGAWHWGLPRIWKLRHAKPTLPSSCSRKEVLLAARPSLQTIERALPIATYFTLLSTVRMMYS